MRDVSTMEVGPLGVLHLKRLWFRVTSAARGHSSVNRKTDEWTWDRLVIHGLGLALEETLWYLGQNTPSYDEFEQWIVQKNGGPIDHQQIERINITILGGDYSDKLKEAISQVESSEPVLTPEDLVFWDVNGYVIVPRAVPIENCRAAEQAIWEFLKMNPNDSNTWYKKPGIMVQFFHHSTLDANRRSPRVRKAFAQIWNTADLWTTVDRVSFNPPERLEWKFPGPHLHWDTRLTPPIKFGVSGLIYLTDTTADQGAFTCVPGFQRRINDWLRNLPSEANPQAQDLERLGPMPIAGRAGDLIIWQHALPHGSRPNHTDQPRIVQYLTMYPIRRTTNKSHQHQTL